MKYQRRPYKIRARGRPIKDPTNIRNLKRRIMYANWRNHARVCDLPDDYPTRPA